METDALGETPPQSCLVQSKPPHDLNLTRTRAATAGGRRLAARVTARSS
jgi:hypothetical protein